MSCVKLFELKITFGTSLSLAYLLYNQHIMFRLNFERETVKF